MIHAAVNGEATGIAPGTSLLAFITSKNLTPEHTVIEHNGSIAAREQWGQLLIGDGDTLEIVKFLGGG